MIETKIVRQHDQRDCGAACLSMIGRYYGVRYPITKYRELTKTDKMGANLYGIVDGARRIGLTAEALSGSPDELFEALSDGSVCFPFISHTISNDVLLHYVVVTGIKKGKFVIADPAKGRYLLTPEEFFEIWTGYIVTFQKTAEFIEGDFEKGSNTRFFLLLKGQYHKLLGILLLSLIISAVGILGAFVFEVVIDRFATDTGYYETHGAEVCGDDCTDNHDHQVSDNPIDSMIEGIASVDFNIMFIALIVLYMLLTGIQFVRGYLIIDVAKKIDLSLSLSYYLHIIDLPMSSLNTRQTGEYLSRLSDTDAIRTAISSATVTLLMDTIMVIGCGVILYSLNKEMFFVALLMVVLYAIIVLCYRKPVESSNRVAMEKNALLQSYFKETIDGLATVKAACANQAAKDTISSKLHAFMDAVVKNNLISMTQDTLSGTVELVGTALILWIGFGLVLAEQVTIGSLVTFYVLLAYFTTPIKNIIELQPTIQTAVVAADRLNDVLELSTEEDGKKSADLEEIQELEFRNVNFRYGNRELVLDDVSLTVRSGEKIGIVGQSGSGKTTLAKLLLRFYDLETGRIMLNGQDISTIELNVLRKNIAYVDQDIFFFSETIRNNLRLGNRELTDDEIVEACKVSQAHQFITELPMGYDTPLDENAANLSGGQRQRLAIARALLKRPKVLLLDEATSNLDMVTEMSIRTTMMNMNEKMISIIIAHRLSTVKNCDRIYVMDRGKIVECGTHEELLRAGKKYAELWNNQ